MEQMVQPNRTINQSRHGRVQSDLLEEKGKSFIFWIKELHMRVARGRLSRVRKHQGSGSRYSRSGVNTFGILRLPLALPLPAKVAKNYNEKPILLQEMRMTFRSKKRSPISFLSQPQKLQCSEMLPTHKKGLIPFESS